MSTLKVNNLQVGQDGTAANNYTLYQPASPDGTVRLGYGVAGSVTDILTLKNSNLGIGTNNPTTESGFTKVLHVYDDSPQVLLERETGSGDVKAGFNAWSGNASLETFTATPLRIRTSGNTNQLYLNTNGNVGIGTSNPTEKLHVEGHLLAVDGSSGLLFEEINNGAALWLDGANGDFSGGDYYGIIANNNAQLQLGYAGASDLVITSDGKIGIGTDNPSQKLVVKGTTSLMATNSTNQWMAYTYTDNTFR